MKFCPTCNRQLNDDANFCPVDGTPIAPTIKNTETEQSSTLQSLARPYDSMQEVESPESHSGAWFALGDEAEQQLKTGNNGQGLPALYAGIDEDSDVGPKRLSTNVIIGLVAGGCVLILIVVAALLSGDDEKATNKPKPAAVAPAEPAGDAETVAEKSPPAVAATKPVVNGTVNKSGDANHRSKTESSDKPVDQPEVKRPSPSRHTASDNRAELRTSLRSGQQQLARGDYVKAQRAFETALKLDPSSAVAHGGLGEVNFELGNYATAAMHFKSALRSSSKNVRYLVMLGNSYFKQRRANDAVVQYRQALKLDPGNASAKTGLAAAERLLAR